MQCFHFYSFIVRVNIIENSVENWYDYHSIWAETTESNAESMNLFLVLSLDSGLPLFHKHFASLHKMERSSSGGSPSSKVESNNDRDIMHVSSLIYALRKLSASIDSHPSSSSGSIPTGTLHHMQQVSICIWLLLNDSFFSRLILISFFDVYCREQNTCTLMTYICNPMVNPHIFA